MISINRKCADESQEFRLKDFPKFSSDLIQSRKHTCGLCGFKSERYLRLLSRVGHYQSRDSKDYVVSCPFCLMPHRLELAVGKGMLIYLPELTQSQLNMFMHNLFLFGYESVHGSTQYFYSSDCYNRFASRANIVEEVLGPKGHLPENLVVGLKGLSDEEYSQRNALLRDIRFMPFKEAFAEEIGYWVNNAYWPAVTNNPKVWSAIAHKVKQLNPDIQYGN